METNIEQKLDQISIALEELRAEHRFKQEMWDEFSPILKLAMNSGGDILQRFEEKGYFAFFKGAGVILDEIITNYTPEDLEQLSKSIVGILDTIRTLTQDDVLQLANEAALAIHEADKNKPMGLRAMVKATTDHDVRRGMSMIMELLRHVGKGAKDIKRSGIKSRPRFQVEANDSKQQRLAKLLAPKRKEGDRVTSSDKKASPKKEKSSSIVLEGVELDAEGFFEDPGCWNRELAEKMAVALGFNQLTNEHWVLIDFARAEYLETKAAPNMRRLSVGSKVPTKTIFLLFPAAPAKTIAKIAGIKKPVGCI